MFWDCRRSYYFLFVKRVHSEQPLHFHKLSSLFAGAVFLVLFGPKCLKLEFNQISRKHWIPRPYIQNPCPTSPSKRNLTEKNKTNERILEAQQTNNISKTLLLNPPKKTKKNIKKKKKQHKKKKKNNPFDSFPLLRWLGRPQRVDPVWNSPGESFVHLVFLEVFLWVFLGFSEKNKKKKKRFIFPWFLLLK